MRDVKLGDMAGVQKSARVSLSKMAAIRGVLVDLSGTLHIDNTVIPGSIEALKRYLLYLTLFRFISCFAP